jgi:Protein of unknown function (DUF3667)
MVSEIEAVGDILTGGLVSRAVEPEAGEGTPSAATNCFNCTATVIGNHCHNCGQKTKVHRTLSAFGHDILHSVLHFDGKIWRTLPLLAWYPGELTRRYVHGERAKFVSPIALFLFSVFLSFAVFNSMLPKDPTFDVAPATAAEAAKSLAKDRAELVKAIADLEAEKKAAAGEDVPTGWMDDQIVRLRALLVDLDTKKAPEVRQLQIADRKMEVTKAQIRTEIARQEALLAKAKADGASTKEIVSELADQKRALEIVEVTSSAIVKGKVGDDVKFNFFGNQFLGNAAKHAMENPQLLLYKIQSNAYKYSWMLIPISVPFVWLLFFWRREFKLFDHAVFVTYSLCFMLTLAMLAGTILAHASEGSFVFVTTILCAIFFPPIHMYRQIHRGYETTRFGALWRTFVLSNFAIFALSVFATLILTLGVTG